MAIDKKNSSRSWQRMLSGRRLNLLNPSPLDIEIEDIAKGISRVARWNGQTLGDHPLSVAQHSVIVADIFSINKKNILKKWLLAALLHDAAEYIISDMITPLKTIIGSKYLLIESMIQSAIHLRFRLPSELPKSIYKSIKRCDRQTAFLEAVQIAGFSKKEARNTFSSPRIIPKYRIVPLSAKKAEHLFLNKFHEFYR